MKKLNYIWFSLIWITVLASCDLMGKIDDITPQHQLARENVVSDGESAENLVRNVYLQWRRNDITSLRPAMSFLAGSLEVLPRNRFEGGKEFEVNGVLPDNDVLAGFYTALYRVINAANNAIELIGDRDIVGLTAVRRSELLADCRFHRGMAHFYLLRYFGQFCDLDSRYGIVLRDRSVDGVETAARSSVADSYAFILKDLTAAGNAAPEIVAHYYVSRMTAKAMKAKVLLCMKDYIGAEKLADTVICEASGFGYELGQVRDDDPLYDPYMQVFIDGYNSSEVLFASYSFGDVEYVTTPWFASGTKPSATLRKYAGELGGASMIPFLPDGRFFSIFMLPPPEIGGGGDPDDGGGGMVPDDGGGGMVPDDGGGEWEPDGGGEWEPDGGGEEAIIYNNKYFYGEAIAGKQGNTYFYLRLAEIYYVYAEAAVRNGNYAGAKERLSEVLKRYAYDPEEIKALPDDKADLLELVRKHKLIDLVTENQEEWFDMVRYYYEHNLTMTDLTAIKSTLVSEKQLLLPIPKAALAGNNLLEKNP